jgi:hypothetical protein
MTKMTPKQMCALTMVKLRALQALQSTGAITAPDAKQAAGTILADLLSFITDLASDLPTILSIIAAIEAAF